jgi:hypothetical protein
MCARTVGTGHTVTEPHGDNPAYLDIARTDGVPIAQILLGAERTTEQKGFPQC